MTINRLSWQEGRCPERWQRVDQRLQRTVNGTVQQAEQAGSRRNDGSGKASVVIGVLNFQRVLMRAHRIEHVIGGLRSCRCVTRFSLAGLAARENHGD